MNAWDKRKDEGPEAFEAFVRYRDLGVSRSNERVAKGLGKSKTLMDRWSGKNDWVDRAAAWDTHLDQLNQKARAGEHIEMNRKHVGIAQTFQAKLITGLQNLDVKKLSPQDLIRWAEVSIKIERLAEGVPTELIGALDELDLTKLDDEELTKYQQLRERARAV
jgi:hypothetical protein